MKRCKKYIRSIALCLAVVLAAQIFLMPADVQAAEKDSAETESAEKKSAEKENAGKIEVRLNDIGTNRAGVELACYQVGALSEDGIRYELTEAYQNTGVDFQKIETAEEHRKAAETLEEAVKTSGTPQQTKQTDANGLAVFTGLADGVYLIRQTKSADYGLMQTFLAYVPYTGEDGRLVYEVQADAKGEKIEAEPEKEKSNVKTGDESPVAILVGALVIAGVAAAAVIVMKTRKRKNEK